MGAMRPVDDCYSSIFPSREQFFFPLEQFMNKVYDEFLTDKSLGSFVKSRTGYPRLDIYVNADKWCIDLACPGVRQENLSVELIPDDKTGGRFLKVSGQMSFEEEHNSGTNYLVKELKRGSFERVVRLPDNVKGDPEAVLKDGILSLIWQIKELKQEKKTVQIKKCDF